MSHRALSRKSLPRGHYQLTQSNWCGALNTGGVSVDIEVRIRIIPQRRLKRIRCRSCPVHTGKNTRPCLHFHYTFYMPGEKGYFCMFLEVPCWVWSFYVIINVRCYSICDLAESQVMRKLAPHSEYEFETRWELEAVFLKQAGRCEISG